MLADDCVMVSPDGSCSSPPYESISCAIQNGATGICLSGTFKDHSDTVTFNGINVEIYGTGSLFLNSQLYFEAGIGTSLTFIDVTIQDSYIEYKNSTFVTSGFTFPTEVVIIDCSFFDSKFIFPQLPDILQSLDITMEDSVFQGNNASNCQLAVTKTDELMIRVSKSNIHACSVTLQSSSLYFELLNSSLSATLLDVSAPSYLKIPSIVVMEDNSFVPSTLQSMVRLNLFNPYIIISSSMFANTSFEISVNQNQLQEPTLFLVSLANVDFHHSHKVGNGGALMISSGNVSDAKISISSCTFLENRASKASTDLPGYAGAVYVQGSSVQLQVEHSLFINNSASESGSALYTSEGVLVSITNCTFQYYITEDVYQFRQIFSVSGMMLNLSGSIQAVNPLPEVHAYEMELFSIDRLQKLDLRIHCPRWYQHSASFEDDDVNLTVSKMSYSCQPCQELYYSSYSTDSRLIYPADEFNISDSNTTSSIHGIISGQCISCPYGAKCSGNTVFPQPNYWGHWIGDELEFDQCPPEYCCSGTDKARCAAFDSCAGNRGGQLCGACRAGYSLPILGDDCVPNGQCGGDEWFWVLAVLGTIGYALWYTFKDDIFKLIQTIGTVVKNSLLDLKRMMFGNSEDPGEPEKPPEDVNKGYFGIVMFFVQMSIAMKITIDFSDLDGGSSFTDQVTEYLTGLMNMDFTKFSFSVCPIIGLTTLGKVAYGVLFLLCIYFSWAALFLVLEVIRFSGKCNVSVKQLQTLRVDFIEGLIEIIKYSYVGFCGLIAMSLMCTRVARSWVWFYDATQNCYEDWQIGMLMFGLFYAIPFPFALLFAMKYLKRDIIGAKRFVFCCIFPLVSLCLIGLYNLQPARSCVEDLLPDFGNSKREELPETSKAILSRLQGPFKAETFGKSASFYSPLYWEAVISVRRLLVTSMTLIPYHSERMMVITCLCASFLIHHFYVFPFAVRTSNHVEMFSLLLLLFTAIINLLKASLIDSAAIPNGPTVSFFEDLELLESLLVFILVAFIIMIEIWQRFDKGPAELDDNIPVVTFPHRKEDNQFPKSHDFQIIRRSSQDDKTAQTKHNMFNLFRRISRKSPIYEFPQYDYNESNSEKENCRQQHDNGFPHDNVMYNIELADTGPGSKISYEEQIPPTERLF